MSTATKTQHWSTCDYIAALNAALALRGLMEVLRCYPGDIDPSEARRLHDQFVFSLEAALDAEPLSEIKAAYKRPKLANPTAAYGRISEVIQALMLHDLASRNDNGQEGREPSDLANLLREGRRSAPAQFQQSLNRLGKIQSDYCRVPRPVDDPSFIEPGRCLQLGESYWKLCRTIAMRSLDLLAFPQPCPLIGAVENVLARIDGCFENLTTLEGAAMVLPRIHTLMEIATSSEPDDLQVVPDWSIEEVRKVDEFFMLSRAALHPRDYPLTQAEKKYLDEERRKIGEYFKGFDKQGTELIDRLVVAIGPGVVVANPDAPAKQEGQGAVDSSQQAGAPGATSPARKAKRSTERGEGRVKLIAALTKHHKYADGSCLNLEPIANNELARRAKVSNSTASEFLDKEFKGHTKYRGVCGDTKRLIPALKLLNQEFSPFHLYGNNPPGEGGRDDEE